MCFAVTLFGVTQLSEYMRIDYLTCHVRQDCVVVVVGYLYTMHTSLFIFQEYSLYPKFI